MGVVVGIVIGLGYAAWYNHEPVRLEYQLSNIKTKDTIRVNFSHEVSRHLNYNLDATLAGHWKAIHGLVGISAIVFVPSKPLVPGASYHLTVGHVAEPLTNEVVIAEATIKVTTEAPSAIESISPTNGAGNVSVDPTITIKLKEPNDGLRKLKLSSDAPVALSGPTASSDDTTYSWHYASPLPQGATYHLTISDTNQVDPAKQILATSTFTTVAEPTIDATAHDHFYPGNTVVITFSQPMVQTAGIFKFNFGGNGSWTSPNTYTYTPTGLVANQSYSYSVLKGAVSKYGGVITADHSYTIATPGAVYVTGRSPSGGGIGLGASISFTFDQPVDQASAQAAFAISPNVGGSYSWSGNTMTFHPTGFDYQTSYTATVEPGIKATYGVPSTQAFSVGFTTVLQTVSLNVPLYHQTYALSCEESSLRMALAYRGVNVSDYDVLMNVGYNPRPLDTATNSWDDPNVMFVGDVNGQQGVTGWGTNATPIANAAHAFGRSATAINGISASTISAAIHAGNPVVLWGYYGSHAIMQSWNSPDGVITIAHNEHVRTVVGVVGSAANPVGFYINDPIFGRLYWTTSYLIDNMTLGGQSASQGVIVY